MLMTWTHRERDLQVAFNDPKHFEIVRVRVLRPFCIRGERIEPGKVIELERHVADSLAATGRVEPR